MNNILLNQREFMKLVCLAAILLVMSQPAYGKTGVADGKQPNILFIMADDLGCEWLSCYGGEELRTPNLDSLAKGGMRFTNAYSMAQCTSTRVTLLTGQYPCRHGWVNHWDVPRWGAGCHFDWRHDITFARVMKSAGYVTVAAGKWQMNDFRVQPDAMKKHGFDQWCMWTGHETGNPPSFKRYWDPYLNTKDGSKTYKGRFGTDVCVEFLTDFMKRHKDKPMMLYFPMALPHIPFTSTPLDPDAKGQKACQEAMVRYTDHAVGRLVEVLDELKIRDKTIVIFTTDNGSTRGVTARMNGRMVRGGKGSLGEPGVREPFIVNCPGLVPAGVVTDALTDFTDLLPTFAELAGAELPKDIVVDGHSIAELILGKQEDSPREWIMAMGFGPARLTPEGVVPLKPFNDRVVRDKQYKLWGLNGRSAKLFDLLADPAEKNNLINSTDPAVVAARNKLEKVVQSFPKEDGKPKYHPTPPQSWDKKIGDKLY